MNHWNIISLRKWFNISSANRTEICNIYNNSIWITTISTTSYKIITNIISKHNIQIRIHTEKKNRSDNPKENHRSPKLAPIRKSAETRQFPCIIQKRPSADHEPKRNEQPFRNGGPNIKISPGRIRRRNGRKRECCGCMAVKTALRRPTVT